MRQPVTGSFEFIKNLNTACILNTIRLKGSVSRADIARLTGLTPATVSNLTAELIDLSLIIETDRGQSNGGRKPVMLCINRQACYIGGIHIGPNMIEAAVSNFGLENIAECRETIADATPEQTVGMGLRLLEEACIEAGASKLAGIGVSTHGLVRNDDGLLVFAPNLGWSDVKLGEMFSKRTGIPVFVENDVCAMALAENWCGLARGIRDYVYLYIGPGIGGSIVNNGELYKGQGGFSGEFGHDTLEPDGPVCTCGNRGCFQALASETAVLSRYMERKKRQRITPPVSDFRGMLEVAAKGDGDAVEEIIRSVRYIGIEVGNIINALSPNLIVINGEIARIPEIVMPALKDEVKRHCLRFAGSNIEIAFSQLLETAPLKGAETCVIKSMYESPKRFLQGNR